MWLTYPDTSTSSGSIVILCWTFKWLLVKEHANKVSQAFPDVEASYGALSGSHWCTEPTTPLETRTDLQSAKWIVSITISRKTKDSMSFILSTIWSTSSISNQINVQHRILTQQASSTIITRRPILRGPLRTGKPGHHVAASKYYSILAPPLANKCSTPSPV